MLLEASVEVVYNTIQFLSLESSTCWIHKASAHTYFDDAVDGVLILVKFPTAVCSQLQFKTAKSATTLSILMVDLQFISSTITT